MCNGQQDDWPHFSFNHKALEGLEAQFLRNAGESLGAFKHVSEEDKNLLKIELISEEALKTSKIEDEFLDRDSLQSSIGRQFGIRTDHRSIPPAEQGVDGFKGGLSAENYISITGAPRTTVTRDLNDLVAKGALTKTGQLKYTCYHLNIAGQKDD